MKEFAEITEKIKEISNLSPPDDLTQKIMRKISNNESFMPKYWIILSLPQKLYFRLGNIYNERISSVECAFNFFLISLFYLVLAAIFGIVLRITEVELEAAFWLKFQLALITIMALFLMFYAVILLKNVKKAYDSIHTLIFFYFAMIILSGIIFKNAFFRVPYSGYFIFFYLLMAAFIGIHLTLSAQRVEIKE